MGATQSVLPPGSEQQALAATAEGALDISNPDAASSPSEEKSGELPRSSYSGPRKLSQEISLSPVKKTLSPVEETVSPVEETLSPVADLAEAASDSCARPARSAQPEMESYATWRKSADLANHAARDFSDADVLPRASAPALFQYPAATDTEHAPSTPPLQPRLTGVSEMAEVQELQKTGWERVVDDEGALRLKASMNQLRLGIQDNGAKQGHWGMGQLAAAGTLMVGDAPRRSGVPRTSLARASATPSVAAVDDLGIEDLEDIETLV